MERSTTPLEIHCYDFYLYWFKEGKKLLQNIIQATQKIFLRSLYGAVLIQIMPLGAIGSNWKQLGAIGNNWEPLGAIRSHSFPHHPSASRRGNDPP